MVFSTMAVISKKPIRLRRKAHTAISLAAFKMQGMLPALLSASIASDKFLKVLTSGSSKLRAGYFLKLRRGKSFFILPGKAIAYCMGNFISGRPICAFTLPSSNCTMLCMILCGCITTSI